MLQRLWHRVGKRGIALLFLALLDLLYPIGLAGQPAATRAGYEVVAPWQVWAVLWLLTGLLCAAQAFARRDRLAFTVAVAMKVLWGTVALIGWIAGTSPRGWLSALIWLTFAGFVAVISTWTEEWDRP
ncbi:hypothetical protein [Actinomadura litoris]|uniref:Uncharacterized protein n=1 Tax=Actinomadura litoris TaxID=2678616 RepID=A0A7K1LAF0_9ACTN|nr:hypothetical protein [Actinomadura litoris]MUN41394.1 hypothetical protein [Actinomadura litoris]